MINKRKKLKHFFFFESVLLFIHLISQNITK